MKNTIYILSALLAFGGLLMGAADNFPFFSLIMVGAGVIVAALNYQGDLK